MDFSLNDDQRAFVESARAFAEGAMAPNAARWDEESIFPREVLQQAGELGFMGMYTPESAGGLGMGRLDALGWPPKVRAVREGYHDTWNPKRSLR